ncbi:hypothetical protein ETB97_000834 [Aspergillus alliaceus]|uniref:CFEM domain-containing protein n=1 Tax=Petromyces alliaceus TaxID=209559 RepID=A0A5N7CCD8_PETAA|nr:uncharacterized protein BDW43DRAFT_312986 [Aspergillus alliaceus]KAB8231465.1 hypothetical protein BDW43DRAFT_312986 [Aspergillus alliaceus]KAE8391822.1 hypothetical protein BDV23DRAFT_182184 [Aspergillus alliaceus]KAF5861006.1 hypothetical protein ETB97_000834 [Aspergillus burnettii]
MAQQPTPCLSNCIAKADICHGIDIPCFCKNDEFHRKVKSCLDTECNQHDRDIALQLQTAVCK